MSPVQAGSWQAHRFKGTISFSVAGEVASMPRAAAGMLLADSEAVLGAGFAMLAAATLPFMRGSPSASSAVMLTIRGAVACRGASRFRLGGDTMAPVESS